LKDLLNPSQRRSVTVTLRGFENGLRQALGWLDGRSENGILYRGTLNLSTEKREAMRLEIASALEEIATLSRVLGLDREEEDARGLIRSEMSVAWANLLDTQSKKLRGYGDVDPQLADVLDPGIIHLSSIAIRLANLLDDAPASGEKS
jgi:hypothetical protein